MDQKIVKPLWRKIFSSTILIYLISTIVLVFGIMCVVESNESRNAERNINNTIRLSDIAFASCLRQYETDLNNPSNIKRFAMLTERNWKSNMEYQIQIREQMLNGMFFSMPGICGISFLDKNGCFISVGQMSYNDSMKAIKDISKEEKSIWRYWRLGEKNCLLYNKKINYYDSSLMLHECGDLLICMDEEKVYKNCFKDLYSQTGIIIAIDNGNIISTGGSRDNIGSCFSDVFTMTHRTYRDNNGQRCYVSYIDSSVDGWKLVGVVPVKDIYAPIMRILCISLAAICISWFIFMIILRRAVKLISKPLIDLADKLGKVGNGKYERLEDISDSTEVGFLYSRFNDMVASLENEIDQNLMLRLEIQQAHIENLEHQINPHFMFNTLQMLQMMALTGRTEDMFDVVGIFGEIIRFNLQPNAEVTIEEEIANLENYFRILQLRFYGNMDYQVMADPEIMSCYTIKFLLQPIVENAVSHGFRAKTENCSIKVVIKRKENDIEFCVTDNGEGMTEERIREVIDYIENESNILKTESIGLKNVNHRIKLLYGQEYGIKLESKYNIGTSITVTIPVCTERRYLSDDPDLPAM